MLLVGAEIRVCGGRAGRSRFVGQDTDCHFCCVKFEM